MAGQSFSGDSARRLAASTRRIEQTPRFKVDPDRPPVIATGPKYAIVTTEITAANRSITSLGKGAGMLQFVRYDANDNASYYPTGQTVPIYSGATGTNASISTGDLVIVDFIEGRFNVIVDFCS